MTNQTLTHEVDLLLSCGCIRLERIEAVIYLPNIGEQRTCHKHGSVKIIKRGNPYWINIDKETKQEI